MQFRTHRGGILLMDVLVGVAVFAILIGSVIFTLLTAQRSILKSGDRMQAVFYAQQALEAVRSIRNGNFDDILLKADPAEEYGIQVTSDVWELVDDPQIHSGYTVSVILTKNAGGDTVYAQVDVSWNFSTLRSGSVSLTGQYTDWRRTIPIGDWKSINREGYYVDDGTPLFNDAVAIGDYLYVTSEFDSNKGLYIFNISDTTNPSKIPAVVDIGGPGYGITSKGNYLFVISGDQNSELLVFDVSLPSDPLNLTVADHLIDSGDVDANGVARAIDISGNYAFVTAEAAGESNADSITTFSIGGTLPNYVQSYGTFNNVDYTDISVVGNYAYVSNPDTSKEIVVVDVQDPSTVGMQEDTFVNVNEESFGLTVQAINEYALLGRSSAVVTGEAVLFDISSTPPISSSPEFWNVGAPVTAVDMDVAETYGFLATENEGKQFIVMHIDDWMNDDPSIPSPEVAYASSTVPGLPDDINTGFGRGIYYSWEHDRVFLMTQKGVLIFEPTGPGT